MAEPVQGAKALPAEPESIADPRPRLRSIHGDVFEYVPASLDLELDSSAKSKLSASDTLAEESYEIPETLTRRTFLHDNFEVLVGILPYKRITYNNTDVIRVLLQVEFIARRRKRFREAIVDIDLFDQAAEGYDLNAPNVPAEAAKYRPILKGMCPGLYYAEESIKDSSHNFEAQGSATDPLNIGSASITYSYATSNSVPHRQRVMGRSYSLKNYFNLRWTITENARKRRGLYERFWLVFLVKPRPERRFGFTIRGKFEVLMPWVEPTNGKTMLPRWCDAREVAEQECARARLRS